jgi:hypothetical protein
MALSSVSKLFNTLVVDRNSLTAKQIAHRFCVANPYDLVYNLRREGYIITLIPNKDTKGRVKLKYVYTGRHSLAA